MSKKIAVVLLNLGGPQNLGQVKEFLFSLFYDKYILNYPNPIRWLLAFIISTARKKKSQKIYQFLGGKSPIVDETKKQAEELQTILNKEKENKYKVFICMRHSAPGIHNLEKEIKEWQPQEIIGIPLYPQLSYTTTHSAINSIKNKFKNIKFIGCFYNEPLFIKSQVKLIRQAIDKSEIKNSIIIFSAHGLPVKIIEKGDPYQSQVEKTVELVVHQLPKIKYIITYQSKIGKTKWLEPSTDQKIKETCKKKLDIILFPISFVSENSKTLVELDIEYAKIAEKQNVKYFRVQTVRIEKEFIECLKSLVLIALKQNKQITSATGERTCDKKFKQCLCN